jgi:hypothetical protein
MNLVSARHLPEAFIFGCVDSLHLKGARVGEATDDLHNHICRNY